MHPSQQTVNPTLRTMNVMIILFSLFVGAMMIADWTEITK
jgi:hypothetical protein